MVTSASKQAFKTSRTSNLTNGATHFLSKTDLLRPPKWLWASEVTHKSGDFTFYRRKEDAVACKLPKKPGKGIKKPKR
jgi:hypothetical protein